MVKNEFYCTLMQTLRRANILTFRTTVKHLMQKRAMAAFALRPFYFRGLFKPNPLFHLTSLPGPLEKNTPLLEAQEKTFTLNDLKWQIQFVHLTRFSTRVFHLSVCFSCEDSHVQTQRVHHLQRPVVVLLRRQKLAENLN